MEETDAEKSDRLLRTAIPAPGDKVEHFETDEGQSFAGLVTKENEKLTNYQNLLKNETDPKLIAMNELKISDCEGEIEALRIKMEILR